MVTRFFLTPEGMQTALPWTFLLSERRSRLPGPGEAKQRIRGAETQRAEARGLLRSHQLCYLSCPPALSRCFADGGRDVRPQWRGGTWLFIARWHCAISQGGTPQIHPQRISPLLFQSPFLEPIRGTSHTWLDLLTPVSPVRALGLL